MLLPASPHVCTPRRIGGKRRRCREPLATASSPTSFRVERDPQDDARIRAVTPFHLAIPVANLEAARSFYGGVMGLPEGRSAARWVDWNFYGHQLVCHVVDGYEGRTALNSVDGDPVPVPHFGLALPLADFHALTARLTERGVKYELEPHLRFRGAPGEQWCAFLRDPSGNAIEIKAMTQPQNLFAQYTVNV